MLRRREARLDPDQSSAPQMLEQKTLSFIDLFQKLQFWSGWELSLFEERDSKSLTPRGDRHVRC
jgi:hypothetical protein